MAQANVVRISQFNKLSEDLEAAVRAFLSYCRAKNLSVCTTDYYHFRLKAFQKFLGATAPAARPKDITPQIVRDFLTLETEENSASTASHSYITLRAFFNFLTNDGFLPESPMGSVQRPKQRRTVINTFTLQQIEAVLATCQKDFAGTRDRAMILVMLDCGLRVSELCGLALDDVNWAEQTMLVVGKGDVERIVPFGNTTRQALTHYLARRGQLDTGSLFVSVYAGPIDRYRVRRIIQARCEKVGMTGVRCSPHTLRHTCAVQFLRNGADVFSLQKLLGHRDLLMTRRYAELSQTDVQQKHRLYSPADRLQGAQGAKGRKQLR